MWIRKGHGGTRNLFLSGSKEQGEVQKFKGIFWPKLEFQVIFPAENRWSPKKRSSSQKLHKNLCKSTKNTNLGLDLRFKALSLFISWGLSPRLGGTIFVWGAQAVSWGGTAPGRWVWDEKTLEWAKRMVEAIVPSLVVHQGYDAKVQKDLPPAKTFGMWLPEDEGWSISDTLTLVSRCNAKISRRDLETKHSAKGNGGVLHVVSVRESSLNHAGGTELQSIPWLSSGSVPEEEKCQAVSEPGNVIAIAKGWWNLWDNNGYS